MQLGLGNLQAEGREHSREPIDRRAWRPGCHPGAMSDLTRRPGSGMSRGARERRAYQLVLVGGGASVVALVTFVLAIVGVMGFGIPVLALIVALLCLVMLRRMVARR